jgi:hypothetical protein
LIIEQFARIHLVVDEDSRILCENFNKHLKAPIEYITAKGIAKGARIR